MVSGDPEVSQGERRTTQETIHKEKITRRIGSYLAMVTSILDTEPQTFAQEVDQ
jgi:hypothetical protein